MTRLVSSLAALAALCCAAVWAPMPAEAAAADGVIVVRGNKMYNEKTGERFMIKGMTYEYAVSDSYYTKYSKAVIAKNLKDLKFNTLRVYNINPEESYALFMKDMAALGVYVMVAASPDNSEYFGKYRYAPIRKDLPPEASSGETCYPALLLEYGKKIAQNFAQYDNTLAMIIANEIMQTDLKAAACVKQYSTDLKNWMRTNGKMMRILPLSYAAADSAYSNPKLTTTVLQPEEYHTVKIQGLLCGDTMKDGMMLKSIDIYLINEYRWCEKATYDGTYARFLELVRGIPIVVALGEYGCRGTKGAIRTWPMIPYLYQAPTLTKGFTNVFSGGLAYSYGQAKLSADSEYPMFTGGSLDPMSTPSSTATTDYTNLKSQFAKYLPYSDPASWTKDTKCTWAPTITETISATNTRAAKNGWIVDSCTASVLKIASTDTWVAKTRQGAACNSNGAACEVSMPSPIGTTQETICGGVYKVESGGGKCKTSIDCGQNGQCLAVEGVNQCSCLSCWSGSDCSVRDTASCSKLISSKTAPKIIFAGVGGFLAVSFFVFVAIWFAAQKKKRALQRHIDQVKLRAPVDGSDHSPAPM